MHMVECGYVHVYVDAHGFCLKVNGIFPCAYSVHVQCRSIQEHVQARRILL